jgi:hypothetical protein
MLGLILATSAIAQDHLGVRITTEGILAIMKVAIDRNLARLNSGTIPIPDKLYEGKIKKQDLMSNPVVQVLNEISDIDLTRDLPYYFQTVGVKALGNLDRKTLKITVKPVDKKKFLLTVSGNINKVELTAKRINLCEDKIGKKCGNGLQANFINPSIKLDQSGPSISLEAQFEIDISGLHFKMSLKSLKHNLASETKRPKLIINLEDLVIPSIVVVINGERAELDTSHLKEKLLSEDKKRFLSEKILDYVAEYASKDLVTLVNDYFKRVSVQNSWRVLEYRRPIDESVLYAKPYIAQRDATYVAPSPLTRELTRASEEELKLARDMFESMMLDLLDMIRSAQVDLGVTSVIASDSKMLDVGLQTSMNINGRSYIPLSTVGNSSLKLAPIGFTASTDHVQVAISEPLLNSILDAGNRVGIVRYITDFFADNPAFKVTDAKVHFAANGRIHLVAMSEVDLDKAPAEDVGEWFEYKLGSLIEHFSKCSMMMPNGVYVLKPGCKKPIIKFPVQLEIAMAIVEENMEPVLKMVVLTPFASDISLKNDYGYPSNYERLVDRVQKGVTAALKDGFKDLINQSHTIPVGDMIDAKGVKFKLKNVSVVNRSHLLIGADIEEFDIETLRNKK